MHAILSFLLFWGLAFLTLTAALLLLNIYYSVIGNDLTLLTAKEEATIAGIASLIEGASAWIIFTYLPLAARAMFAPAVVVAILYKLTHLEDWNRYDLALLLAFQTVIGCSLGFLFFGHFQAAFVIVLVFAAFLGIIGSFVKNL